MNTQTLTAIRELVEAGEAAGWDATENAAILQAGREAYAALLPRCPFCRNTTETLPCLHCGEPDMPEGF